MIFKNHLEKILARFILKQSVSNFILKFLGIIFSYSFSVLIAKKFGSEGNGIFSIAMAVTSISILICKFGFDTALLKYTSFNEARGDRFLTKQIYLLAIRYIIPLTLFISVIQFISSSFIAEYFFKNTNLSLYIGLLSLSVLPFVLSLIHSEGLRGLHKTLKYIFIQSVGVFMFATIGTWVLSYFYSLRVEAIFWCYIVSVYLILFASIFWWGKALSNIIETRLAKKSIKEILSNSLPMFWSNAMFVLIMWADIIMLGYYTNAEEVGIYAIAVRIASIISLPLIVINGISAPKFSEYHSQDNKKGLAFYIYQTNRTILLLSIPAFLISLIFAKQILAIFGQEFIIGSTALIILAIGQFFKSFCGSTDFLLQMTGHEKIFQKIIISAMAINIFLNYLLIPKFGIIGAAVANLTSIIYWNIMSVVFIKLKLSILSIYIPSISTFRK